MISPYKAIAASSQASQNKEELLEVLELVGKTNPKVIVEIGVHRGFSLEVWKNAFHPDVLIGIENDLRDLTFKDFDLIPGDSHSEEVGRILKEKLAGRKIDFLFIDGDHTLEGVRRDYELYSLLVRDGGVIGFHDVLLKNHPLVEVHQLWDLLKAETKHSEIHYGEGTGTGLLWL